MKKPKAQCTAQGEGWNCTNPAFRLLFCAEHYRQFKETQPYPTLTQIPDLTLDPDWLREQIDTMKYAK